MATKPKTDEGVALNIPTDETDRFESGVPVSIPADASEKSESKSTAKSAASKKEQ